MHLDYKKDGENWAQWSKMKNNKNAHMTYPTLLILVVSRELLKCEASLANESSLPRLVEVRTVKQKVWGSHLRYEDESHVFSFVSSRVRYLQNYFYL